MCPNTSKAWFLLLVGGCSHSYPLLEVPLVGGSEDVREIIEEELAFFSEAILPEQVELSKIVVGKTTQSAHGQYRTGRRRISLDEQLPIEDIARVLRHELCHALDYQTHLADEPDETIDSYAERIYDPEIGGERWERGARDRRGEALALFCELGPVGAAALSTPCPGEAPLLSDLADFSLTEVWRGVPPDPRPRPVDPPVSFAGALHPFFAFTVAPTNDSALVELSVYAAQGDETFVLDPRDGEPVEPGPELQSLPRVDEVPPLGHSLEAVTLFFSVGWPDNALAIGSFEVDAFDPERDGYPHPRLLWSGGEGWLPVPLCLPANAPFWGYEYPRWALFTAHDQVWYAEGDGQQIWWSPVTEEGL